MPEPPEPLDPGEVPEPVDPNDPGVNIAGGGGLYTEGGPVTVTGSTFEGNDASEEGGGISIDNSGDVKISDSVIRNNRAGADGGGIENSGFRVTFERLHVVNNYAVLNGGGIYNSSSNPFFILDSTVERNSAVSGGGLANAPDNDLIVRRSLFLRNVARHPVIGEDGDIEEGGHGGGIFSLADGDSLIENTTISGNVAATGGGGIFHDADGELKLINLTVWRNSAPRGGGIGVAESDFVPDVPPKANEAVVVRNSIVGGSVEGGSCDFYVTSEGGNMDTGGKQYPGDPATGEALLPEKTKCFLAVAGNSDSGLAPMRDRFSPTFTVDALADNGGSVMTHRLNYGSLAIDAAVTPCPDTDARGIPRPQNGRCDMGAFEFVGDPPPPDDHPAGHRVPLGPDPEHRGDHGVAVHGERQPDRDGGPQLRVPALRRRPRRRAGGHRAVGSGAAGAPVARLQQPVGVDPRRRGGSHALRGPRGRPERQRRPDAGDQGHLAGRGAARDDHRRAPAGGHEQPRRPLSPSRRSTR